MKVLVGNETLSIHVQISFLVLSGFISTYCVLVLPSVLITRLYHIYAKQIIVHLASLDCKIEFCFAYSYKILLGK